MRTDYFDDLLPDPVTAQAREMDQLKRDAAELVRQLEAGDPERDPLDSAVEVVRQKHALIIALADMLNSSATSDGFLPSKATRRNASIVFCWNSPCLIFTWPAPGFTLMDLHASLQIAIAIGIGSETRFRSRFRTHHGSLAASRRILVFHPPIP